MSKLILFFCTVLLFQVAGAQQGVQPVQLTDMLLIKTVRDVALSPDGSKAVFTLTSIEPDEKNKQDYRYVNQLYLAPADGSSAPVQLTWSKDRAAQPAWSPDGRQLAFVRAVEGKPQVFILPLAGGEAWQLTRLAQGASAPRWSPDGKQIVFASSLAYQELLKDTVLNRSKSVPVWPVEQAGFSKNEQLRAARAGADPNGTLDQVRAYLQGNEADAKARVLSKLNFQNESDVSGEMSFGHFFITDVRPGAQSVQLTSGFYGFNEVAFTPDGRHLIMSGDIDSLEHPDRSLESELFIANRDGSNLRLLLGKAGMSYGNAKVSPSGKWIAFLQSKVMTVNVPQLSLMPIGGTEKDIITIPLDRNINQMDWGADDRTLFFTAQSNGGVPLYRLDVPTRKLTRLSDVNSGITSFDVAGNRVVFARTEVANPSELFVADLTLKNAKPVSRFNDWVKTRKLSIPEKHSFVNDKGLTVEYWVMKPANYSGGAKFPLLLEIHGGPSAMWGPGEASMWHEYQYFCSKGYGVVYSNPRGSGGYGETFLRGNINDWGKGPSSDVLTAVDRTIAEGWADTSRLFITGGSYAGYLTAWIIAHDQRFRAACAQRGVYDLATFFGEGNAWRLVPQYFGGYPWESPTKAILERESPINYVDNIRTPFIIFHGENDRRTGVIQSEMLYRSLKVLNRPVEYVRHPGATHEITRTGDNRQRLDQMLRTWEFFERWMR